MATSGNEIKTTSVVDFKQTGADELRRSIEAIEKGLDNVANRVKRVGQNDLEIIQISKDLQAAMQGVINAMKKGDLETDEFTVSLGKLRTVMAGMGSLKAGMKLLDPDAEKNVRAAEKAINDLIRAQEKLNAQGIKDARSQNAYQANLRAQAVQDEAAKRQALIDQRAEQNRRAIRDPKYFLSQDTYFKGLDSNAQRARQNENQVAQYSRKGDAARSAAVFQASFQEEANLARQQKAQEVADRRKAREDAVAARRAQRAAEAEDARVEREVRSQNNYQANLRAKAARDEERRQAEEAKPTKLTSAQRGIQSRAELATGEGAASLLLIQGAIRANSALLTGFTNSIQNAIGFAVQLEASFRNVQAVIGATGPEMLGLEKVIKDVSMGTRFSAVEVSEAALALGQAGLSAKQIAESIQPVITLANASGASVAQAVDLVTSVVGVFDKNSSDVADVANKITQASNSSKVSVDKLALGFQYAGNTAAQMGISFEETTAAMAAMSNAGIKSGSTMGTGLRQFLTEVQKPSDDFLGVLQRLGLSISDLDFRSKGFIGVMKTLRESGFVASDAIASFDVRGAAAFNALLARPDDLQNQYDMLSGSTAALKANEIQMNSLSAQGSRLTNTLGAMASTGFQPVLTALTSLIRSLSDGLAAVSEFSGVLQAMAIVFTGLAGGVAVAWLGPLIIGLGTVTKIILGISTGGTAAAAGLTAVGAAAPAAATGVTVLTGAVQALFASMSTMTLIAGGVGVAIMAGLAAYSLYNASVTTTAEQIENLEAKMNQTKGAAQEKSETITALTNRLEILQAREKELNSDQVALTGQVRETNDIMVRWGFTINSGTNNLEALRSKIREVRGELEKMRFADLSQVETDAKGVFEARQREAQEKASRFNYDSRSAQRRSLGSFDGEQAFLDSYEKNDPRRAAFAQTLQRLRTKEGTKSEFSAENSALEGALRTFANDPNSKLNFLNRGGVKDYVESLGNVNRAQNETRQAEYAYNSAKGNRVKEDARMSFDKLLRDNGVDLEGAFAKRNLADEAKDSLPADKKTDAVALNEATRALTMVRKASMEAERDRALKLATTEDQRLEINGRYSRAVEDAGESFRKTAAGAQKELKIRENYSSEDEELRKLRGRIQGGKISEADQARVRQIYQNKADNKFAFDTAGMEEGREKSGMRVKANREAQENIDKFAEDVGRAADSAAGKALKSQEASYRALIDARMREAKSYRGRANANTPLDDLAQLMDEGLEKIQEAKTLEVSSIAREFPKGSIEYKNRMEAANEKYEASAQSFIGSFSQLFEAATERTYGITKLVKQIDTRIKQIANKTEEDLYKSREGLRANDLENARNTGPVSGRNRSDVDTYLNNRAREPIELESVRNEMAGNLAQSNDIERLMETVQEKIDYATARVGVLEQKKNQLLGGKEVWDLSTQEAQQVTPLLAELDKLEKILADAGGKMEGFTNKVQTLRTARDSLQLKEAGLTPGADAYGDWDNLTASMEKTWEAYNKFVTAQSVTKTLEGGLFSSLQGVGGQLSTFFSTATQGTVTVGQAFRTMAGNIIKSMSDVLAQALAMQAVKSILGAFMGAAGSGGITASTVSFGTGTGVAAASSTGLLTSGSAGTGAGFSMLARAKGGPIVGGIPGQDSVPVAAMPGEFMIKKTAVDALGMDYMTHLNNTTSNATSNISTPAVGPALKSAMGSGGGVVNVWVVSPEEMGSNVGPTDIVATISDDISRGGPIKKLIKSVQMGA